MKYDQVVCHPIIVLTSFMLSPHTFELMIRPFFRYSTVGYNSRMYSNGVTSKIPLITRGSYAKSYFSWKVAATFFIAGGYVAYSEILFEKYSEYTSIDEQDELIPVQLDFQLRSLPLYQRMVHSLKSQKWIKLSSWENLDRNVFDGQNSTAKVKNQEEYSVPSLTNHTLAKPGGILIKPVIFHNIETDETVTIVHMGYKLCGYPFIIHGGIIATLLNETFKRNASLSNATTSSLKDDFKVESMSINYKRPLFANQFFAVKTKVEKSNLGANQVTLHSVIESENGKVLVDSVAILQNTGRATKIANESQASKWAIF